MFALWVTPAAQNQGFDAVRLLYLHVPTAWIAYLAFGVTALASAAVAVPAHASTRAWDLLAGASAEVGVVFTGLDARPRFDLGQAHVGNVVGVGRPAHDAPPSSSSSTSATSRCAARVPRPTSAGKRCAIAALIAFADVPIELPLGHLVADAAPAGHRLQPEAQRADRRLDGVHARRWRSSRSRCLYGYLVLDRFELAQLEEGREERELQRAIAERVRAEPGGGAGMSHNWSFVIVGYSITRLALERATSAWIEVTSRRQLLTDVVRDENFVDSCRPAAYVAASTTVTELAPLRPRASATGCDTSSSLVLCLGAIGWMLVLMQKNVVFFKTVSQAVHDEAHDGTRTMRIGGGVVPGSIHQLSDGADFELTEGGVDRARAPHRRLNLSCSRTARPSSPKGTGTRPAPTRSTPTRSSSSTATTTRRPPRPAPPLPARSVRPMRGPARLRVAWRSASPRRRSVWSRWRSVSPASGRSCSNAAAGTSVW